MATAASEPASPDRLENYPHPRETHSLYGQAKAESAFLHALQQERLHHAWLLSGPEGIGKATLAYRIATFMLSDEAKSRAGKVLRSLDSERHATDAQLVASGSHPNVMVLRRSWNDKSKQFSAFIQIDDVRELQRFLGTTAGKGKWRIVLVDSADDLNVNAANALLKMLEEPPPFCLFLLISSQPGRLPVTIRSRCRRLMLEPLSAEDLGRALASISATTGGSVPTGDDLSQLHGYSSGSVRLALELGQEGTLAVFAEINRMMDMLPRVDQQQVLALAERLAGKAAQQQYETYLHVLLAQLAERIRQQALEATSDARALAHWAELWETIGHMRYDVDRLNLDRGNFVIDLFAHIEEMARRAGGLKR